jgi:ribosomal protein L37AE/L43A
MPYYKQSKHFNQVKRCPECRNDSMRFIEGMESWICKVCSNTVREDFYQTVLPSSRELETDEIQPDNDSQLSQRTPLYIKSIKAGDTEQDYETSVNRGSFGAAGSENKYTGSAQSALRQDNVKFHDELRQNASYARRQRSQLLSSSVREDHDSQERLLDSHRQRKLRDRDDGYQAI